MNRWFFLLATVAVPAIASTCDYVSGSNGTANCVDSGSGWISEFSVEALAGNGSTSTIDASFSRNLVLTVSGGTGQGYFGASFFGVVDWYRVDGSRASGNLYFGSTDLGQIGLDAQFGSSGGSQFGLKFTYGVPLAIREFGSADAFQDGTGAPPHFRYNAYADITVTGFLFSDLAGNPITPDYSLELASVPEPASVYLMAAGLLIGVAKAIRRSRR